MGKDWRSPGEAWVKTGSLGWQRLKLMESQLHPIRHQLSACSWPPKAEYGSHMEANCRPDNIDSNMQCGTDDESSGIESRSSTGSDSREDSTSPRPSSSDLIDRSAMSSNHLFPITISSPYGQFHYQQGKKASNSQHLDAQRMPRSLSSEPKVQASSEQYNLERCDFQSIRTKFSQMTGKESMRRKSEDADELPAEHYARLNDSPILLVNSKIGAAGRREPVSREETSKQLPTSICGPSSGNRRGCSSRRCESRAVPHCRISVRTREVAMYNTISEAFYRLDFCNSIHDIRRFNYICKLLHLLITQSLTSLSGCATKVLFTMLEQIACEVSTNKRNIHVLKNLLDELRTIIQKYYCWGRPIGSSALWQQHFDTIERISQAIDRIELSNPKEDDENTTSWNSLPVEMIREILLRLNDYRDLLNSARASPVMRAMVDDHYIWQKLCLYHFTEKQVKEALESQASKRNALRSAKAVKTANPSNDGQRQTSRTAVQKRRSKDSPGTRDLEPTSKYRASSHMATCDASTSRSHVTKTIEIFDKKSSVISTRSDNIKRGKAKEMSKKDRISNQDGRISHQPSGTSNQESTINDSTRQPVRDTTNWEQIFHQLRKKYDLKEEYADSLLLCRQCRCLFWKSIGHPCIGNEEQLEQSIQCCSCSIRPCATDIKNPNKRQDKASVSRQSSQEANPSRASRLYGEQTSGQGRRLSVAMLSRNFDRQARDMLSSSSPSSSRFRKGSVEAASLRTISSRIDMNTTGPSETQANHGRYASGCHHNCEPSVPQRLRSENFLRHNQATPPGSDRSRVQIDNSKETAPKHVAISPQAFLKFFSL